MKNYYKILEVEENASEEEIKKSYRNLSKKYHPDVNPEGAEMFKEINEAYETLGNKQKKQQYDNARFNPYQGTAFESLFQNMFFQNNFQNQFRRKSAPDKVIRLQISPIESFIGVEKNIQYMRDLSCNSCGGSGGTRKNCDSCGGQGFILRTFGTGFMVQQIRTVCSECEGNGTKLIEPCYKCNGKGTQQTVTEVKVKIPVGCDSGQYLKLQNMGDFKNGEIGDLIVQIELQPKDDYEKINNDLIYNLYLDLEGLKKDKLQIPHPDGDLNVDAPKIFDTSKPLGLRGKGYPNGDMYVRLHVRFQRPI